MKKGYGLLIIFVLTLIFYCAEDPIIKEYPGSLSVNIDNSGGPDRIDEIIIVNVEDIKTNYPDFNSLAFVVLDGKKELASQINDLDADHQPDQIVFTCDLTAGQSKDVTIRFSAEGDNLREYKKRTQAEISHKVGGKFVDRKYEGGNFQNVEYLAVPPEHTDHSFFIRYEGPGWESDKVGYRFYLDWRNATDIFGKKTHGMVLQDVGQDGFDSYHEMSDWGMDILKVGDSFGIGSWGMWADGKAHRVAETDKVECAIIANGPVQSTILTKYFGWKIGDSNYDLNSTLTINAGSRMTLCDLDISGQPDNLCTGIVKHDSARIIKVDDKKDGWHYLATYGKQSLADDNLGMVIFYKKSDLIEITEDKLSHLIQLKPIDGNASYYFAAVWEKELNGLTTEANFAQYLDDVVKRLDTPVTVKVM